MYTKYPRTHHLPNSEGATSDDKTHSSFDSFLNIPIVITEKMDGENNSIYKDYFHARSIDSASHPSQYWLKNYASKIGYQLPDGWRLCGENVYAKHSIEYKNLISYFFGFSMWNDKNECLSWDDTLVWFDLLEVQHVPVLFSGVVDNPQFFYDLSKTINIDITEGFVVRHQSSFHYDSFKNCVGKWVRKNHVTSDEHWRNNWVPNKLQSESY